MPAILDTLLNKGGAGTTISRHETSARLNPLIEAHTRLLHAYAYVRQTLPPGSLPEDLEDHLRTARMDVGKLAETVLSSGGVAYNGTALEPGAERLDGSVGTVLRALADREQAVLDAVRADLSADHHLRTKAILGNLDAHSAARLEALREAARRAKD